MNSFIKTCSLLILLTTLSFTQTLSIRGIVVDDATNLPIDGVNIIISENQPLSSTDKSGRFEITYIAETNSQIVFSRIGYKSFRTSIEILNKITPVQIKLKPREITIGEVTVTSTKYSKLEKDVAFPIEVINTDQIENKLAVGIPDILNLEPGITLVRDGIWGTDINIRGLSRQNVVTLIDGNRIETATNHAAGLSLIDLFDIQRVEVIKGGVSSLYGTGATGGVVSITTASASYSDSFYIRGSLSSGYNSMNDGGIGNFTVSTSSDVWFLKLSGTYRSAENAMTPKGILPNSQFRDHYLSASAGIIPLEDHELKIIFQNFKGEDIGIPGGKTFPQTASARYLLAERKMYSTEYRIRNLLPSLSNLSIKYFYQEIERSVELKPNSSTITLPRATHTTNGVQLQTNWFLNNYNLLAAGLDFWQREYNGFREMILQTGSTTKITAEYPVPNSKYMSTGFFAQNESRLLDDKLIITAGGRFDIIKITNEETRNPAYVNTNGVITYPPQNPLASFDAGKYSNKSWSGNLGLLYKLNQSVDLAINFSHAFRSPVLEERFQYINLGGDIYLGNPNLESERGNFLDASIRIWEDGISLKSSLFYNFFNNLVVDKPLIIDSLYQKANIGKARLYGFDLGLEYNFIDKITIYASSSFVRGDDTETNSDLPQIPPLNARIGIKSNIFKYFFTEIASTLFASQNKVAAGEKTTPGFVLFDLYLSSMPVDFNILNLRVMAGIENLLNKDYRYHLSTNRGLIVNEPGRNFFMRMNIAF